MESNKDKNVHIGIDVRTVSQGTGVSRYIEEMLPLLLAKMPEYQFHLFAIDTASVSQFTKFPNVQVHVVPFPKPLLLFYDWFILPLYCLLLNVKVFHGPKSAIAPLYKLFRIRTLVTIHDVIPLTQRKTEKFLNYLYWSVQIPLAYHFADEVMTDSFYSRDELIKRYGPRDGMSVVYLAGKKPINREELDEEKWESIRKKFSVSKNYILYVGTIQPRKHVKQLIEAFNVIKEKCNYSIVIVGKKGWLYKDVMEYIHKHNLENRVIITGFVDNDELFYFYSYAKFFAYISSDEGFGLPLIEAMYYGLPVLTSNRSCLPEIAGEAALCVDPDNISEISEALLQLCEDSNLRTELQGKGFKNVQRFSWQKCAEENIEVYKRIINNAKK